MRIVSKYHDYYDRAAGYGSDEDCVFVRHPVLRSDIAWKEHLRSIDWRRSRYQVDIKPYSVHQFWIGFCGDAFFGAIKDWPGKEEFEVYYGKDATELLKRYHDWKEDKLSKFWRRYRRRGDGKNDFDHLLEKHGQKWPKVFDKLKTPIWVANPYPWYKHSHANIQTNPQLSYYKFGTVVEPNQAYQRIQYYLMNDLNPGMEMPNMDDKYKLMAHGMDDTSFKREKGGPTRKRKKLRRQ